MCVCVCVCVCECVCVYVSSCAFFCVEINILIVVLMIAETCLLSIVLKVSCSGSS